MRGRLYIDGEDVFLKYGAYVVSGGWNELVAMPPLKAVKSNDWQEEDGIEADLSAPVLNTREVTIKFAIVGDFDRYYDFIELLSDGSTHTFRCAEIGRIFRLRLVSQASLDLAKLLGFLSLKFADDYPLDGYEYEAPTGGGLAQSDDYTLDGVRFSDYGVRLLKGSLNEVMKLPAVKPALLRNVASQSGAIYDTQAKITYKSKDAKLTCLLRADSLSEMWRNYYALLHDLTQPNERLLGVAALDEEFPCYYKSCAVMGFGIEGRIWLQFSLTLTFTGSPRIGADTVIATENGDVLVTEDGTNVIDLMIIK